MKKIWLEDPEAHDFPAAADYLDLLFEEQDVKRMVKSLRDSPTIYKKAKDIFRASNLPLLPKSNIHVKENLRKVKNGKRMSPILLIRQQSHLIIADGYHRICAIYYLSEDQEIPCRLV